MLLVAAAVVSAVILRPMYDDPAPNRVSVQYAARTTLYYSESESIIDAGDFLRDTVKLYPPTLSNGYWAVMVHIAPEGAKRLKTWTTSHIGQRVGFFVDGKLINVATVQAPLSDVIMIEGNFTKERAQLIAGKLAKK